MAAAAMLCVACSATTHRAATSEGSPSGEDRWSDRASAAGTSEGSPVPAKSSGTKSAPAGSSDPSGRVGRGSAPATSTVPPAGGSIEIGVQVITNVGALFKAVGAEGSDVDTEAQARAVIAEINRQGGLAGRKVVPVIFEYDAATTDNYATVDQAMCTKWTEDHRVFAAVVASVNMIGGGTLEQCLAKRGVPLIHAYWYNWDDRDFRSWPLLFAPFSASLDRWGRFYVDGLHAQGFFEKGAKIGLLRYDTPALARAANHALKPALARHGLRLTSEATVVFPRSTADYSNTSAQAQNAVLRFRSDGVTHVLFMPWALPFAFMPAAESSGYRPRYGLSSSDDLSFTKQNVPAAQLRRSVGVGWRPYADVDAQRHPGQTPAQRRCLEVMRRGGYSSAAHRDHGVAAGYCDALFFLQAAANSAERLTAGGFREAAERLGASFESASSFGTTLGPARHDGISVVRDFHYADSCSCFMYTGKPRSVG